MGKKFKIFFKTILIFILLIVSFKIYDFNIEFNFPKNYEINNEIKIDEFNLTFCPSKNCFEIYDDNFKKAKKNINCVFFDLNEKELIKTLNEKSKNINVEIVIDNTNLKKIKNSSFKKFSDKYRNSKYNNLIHSKFCIIDDDKIIFGSANPTLNGFYKNNNNIFFIKNEFLAKKFLEEFNQLKNNKFGYGKKIPKYKFQNKKINYKNESFNFSIFFCPKENCKNETIKILKEAKEEIKIMAFVLTDNDIEKLLIQKSKKINITGIFENRLKNVKSSNLENLSKFFNLKYDKNKNSFHHKVFIVDKKIVIFGSVNPTKSGYYYNDEFMGIIYSKNISKLFLNEFDKNFN